MQTRQNHVVRYIQGHLNGLLTISDGLPTIVSVRTTQPRSGTDIQFPDLTCHFRNPRYVSMKTLSTAYAGYIVYVSWRDEHSLLRRSCDILIFRMSPATGEHAHILHCDYEAADDLLQRFVKTLSTV